ncbi:MAG: hypothetical protein WCI55_06500 [Armatimonadota bacterium]
MSKFNSRLALANVLGIGLVASSMAQVSSGGGSGGGSTSEWIANSVNVSGKTKYYVPMQDLNSSTYSVHKFEYDWATQVWTENGHAPDNAVSLGATWYSPIILTGLSEQEGTIKVTLTWAGSPATRPANVWVNISSNAECDGSYGASYLADNGIGSTPTITATSANCAGGKLKKLPVDPATGVASYTVQVHAKATTTGYSGHMTTGTGATITPDSRRIGLGSINYKKVDDVGTVPYDITYHMYGGDRRPGGNYPILQNRHITGTYQKVSRVVNEPIFSDNVTIKGNFFLGLAPDYWYQEFQQSIGGAPVKIKDVGSLKTRIAYHASYSGAQSSDYVFWNATHNEGTGSGTISAGVGATDSIESEVDTDSGHKELTKSGGAAPPIINWSPKLQARAENGTFTAKFMFPDGVSGDASVSFTYKSHQEKIATLAVQNGLPNGRDSWEPLVPWESHGDSAELVDQQLSDWVAVGAFAASIVAAFATEGLEPALLSVVVGGVGSWLDSSLNSHCSLTINKSLAHYWVLELDGWESRYPGKSDSEIALFVNEWKCDVAKHYEIKPILADHYDDGGFSSRGIDMKYTCLTAPGTIPVGDRFYHFRIAAGSGGNGQ